MEDVEVPAENLLGAEGAGFGNFMRTLDNGRIGIAALSLGIAEGAFEQALRYTSVRKQFGQPVAHFQGVQFQLSDMATEIEAGKHLMYHAAWLAQAGKPFTKDRSIDQGRLPERALHARCQVILQESAQAFAELAQGAKVPGGKLRVTAPFDYGSSVVVPVVTRFAQTFEQCGVDGYNLSRTVVPECVDDFIAFVVPELQSRGAYKTRYAQGTLREKLFGLR
jgi:hypothetical protein